VTGSTSNALDDALRRTDPYTFERVVARIWELQGYETTVSSGSRDRGIDIVAQTDIPVQQKMLIQAKRFADGNKIGSQTVRSYATLHQQEPNADAVIIVTTSGFTAEAKRLASDLHVKTVDGDALQELIKDADDGQLAALLELPSEETVSADAESGTMSDLLTFEVDTEETEPTLTVTQGGERVTKPVERLAEAFEKCYEEDLQFVNVDSNQNKGVVGYINEFVGEIEEEALTLEQANSQEKYRRVFFNITGVSEADSARKMCDELTTTFGFDLFDQDYWKEEDGHFMLCKEVPAESAYDYRRDALLTVKILYKLYGTDPEAVKIRDMSA